jgi:hypothetical protein
MVDQKTTELTAITTFSGDETFYVVEDDDGTPVSRKVTVENLGAGLFGFMGIASASTTLTATTPNSLTYVQFGTEEAVVAQADCPTSAVVLAWLACGLRAGPGAPAVGDRGNAKLEVSFDGGSSWADMTGGAEQGSLVSASANRRVSLACVGRSTGTVTGDVQVRASVTDIDQANDTTFDLGTITVLVHPQ